MSELYYDFGFGEVPAHPHPKGGGWIADTAHVDDTCYVGPYAQVYGKAKVTDNAKIDGYAKVFGEARVMQDAKIYGSAKIYQNAIVSGRARVSGNAKVYGNSIVTDDTLVFEFAEVYENSRVRNYCEVHGNAKVKGHAELVENATIYENCVVTRKPIILSGVSACNVVITDHHATVGCVTLPPTIWKKYGKTMIRFFIDMYGVNSPKTISEDWIELMMKMIKIHDCKDIQEEVENFNLKETLNKILSDERFWIQK